MIETVDQQLQSWAAQVLPDAECRFSEPGAEHGLCFYLIGFDPAPTAQQIRGTPLAVGLRYLVSSAAEVPQAAHRMLGRLLFAAMQHEDYEVDLSGVGSDTWRAFGLPPRPAFILKVPLTFDRPHSVQRVSSLPTIRAMPAVTFTGVLVGTNNLPIPRAQVTLTELGIYTSTDNDGRFSFGAVPPTPKTKRLRIQAKGLETETEAQLIADKPYEPIVIRFPATEV